MQLFLFGIELKMLIQKYVECNHVSPGYTFSYSEHDLKKIIPVCLTEKMIQHEELLNWVRRRLTNLGRYFFEFSCTHNEPYADHMNGAEYIAYVAKHGGLNEEELRVLKSKLDHGMTLDSYYDMFASTIEQDTYHSLSGSDCP